MSPARTLSRRHRLCVLALSICLASPLAWAADPPAKPAPTKPAAAKPAPKPAPKAPPSTVGKPIEPVMTREELRACMDQKDKLSTASASAQRQQADLGKEKTEILREGDALKADGEALDRSNPAAVDAFNARVTARNQRIDGFEPKVASYNALVAELEGLQTNYRRDCENRKFDEKDEKALLDKR